MTSFERYVADYARLHINAITKNPTLTPAQLGEIEGWQRVRTLASMTQTKFCSRLRWGERIILQNDPTEFELGIAKAYGTAWKEMVDDYFRIKQR